MKARLFVIALLGAALIAVPTTALGSASHAATNSQSFPDSTGEDANAPDITGVDVSNDDSGLITFKVNVSNRPAFTSDMYFLIFLDTDQNASTGDPNALGADYAIDAEGGAVALVQWNGSTFVDAPSQTSVTFGYDPTGLTVRVAAHDLGGASVVRFGVIAASGVVLDASGNPDTTNEHDDLAPDPGHGFFSYTVIAKLTLKQIAFATTPKPAKSGARFTATLAATESDTNGPVKNATITCRGTIKGVAVRATHSLANGVASCFWKLPKTSKGKLLVATMTVTVKGTTLTKSFSARIT